MKRSNSGSPLGVAWNQVKASCQWALDWLQQLIHSRGDSLKTTHLKSKLQCTWEREERKLGDFKKVCNPLWMCRLYKTDFRWQISPFYLCLSPCFHSCAHNLRSPVRLDAAGLGEKEHEHIVSELQLRDREAETKMDGETDWGEGNQNEKNIVRVGGRQWLRKCLGEWQIVKILKVQWHDRQMKTLHILSLLI